VTSKVTPRLVLFQGEVRTMEDAAVALLMLGLAIATIALVMLACETAYSLWEAHRR